MFGLDTPTSNTYNPLATPDDLDLVIRKKIIFLVYLTSCTALSSEHLPVLIDTTCRLPFQHQISLISGALTGPNSKLTLKVKFRLIRKYTTAWQLRRALRTSQAPS
jgi:hypothetical protein